MQLCKNGKYIYGWVIWKTERRKQTDDRTEKKEKKKGEELEGKGQVLLKGRGTIGCYSVVSVIVYMQKLVYINRVVL